MMTARHDIWLAARFGTALTNRLWLALAATLYAIFTGLGMDTPSYDAAYVLCSGHRWLWAAIFTVDAIALWWRLFDVKPRPIWAASTNVGTFALWVGITGGTVMNAQYLDPDLVGYILFCLVAFHALIRTDLTVRDRETA
jgi:hypothetical protein